MTSQEAAAILDDMEKEAESLAAEYCERMMIAAAIPENPTTHGESILIVFMRKTYPVIWKDGYMTAIQKILDAVEGRSQGGPMTVIKCATPIGGEPKEIISSATRFYGLYVRPRAGKNGTVFLLDRETGEDIGCSMPGIAIEIYWEESCPPKKGSHV